jgi:hypothetical protein
LDRIYFNRIVERAETATVETVIIVDELIPHQRLAPVAFKAPRALTFAAQANPAVEAGYVMAFIPVAGRIGNSQYG